MFLHFLIYFLFQNHLALAAGYTLCPTVVFDERPPFKLTDDEIQLVCGDHSGSDTISQAWSSIPPAQAKLHLTAMLQTRGYHKSQFQNSNGVLKVALGKPTVISQIYLQGAPDNLDINRKREIKGEKLTPNKLDELQEWVSFELKHLGYPCPQVDTIADYLKGEILVVIKRGYFSKILELDSDNVGDLHSGVIRRYDAFHIGDSFDIWNLALSERRAQEDNLVTSTHFSEKCSPLGVVLHQSIQTGLPRLFQIGAGFDTEQGPQFQISTNYSRMNQRGSSLANSFTASYRIQDFTSTLNWYFLRNPSRFYLQPTLELKRDKEPSYEIFESRIGFLPSYSWDDTHNRWDVKLGPSYQTDQTIVGQGPGYSQYLFLDESLTMTSHKFEYFKSNPQSGYKFSLTGLFSNKSVGSTLTASKVSVFAEGLFNTGHFSPPALVLGFRGSVGSTITPNLGSDLINLPPTFRYFLGGTQDLRGFGRMEIPDNAGLGAMTEAFLGLESRFLALLPWNLQPFTFVDAGVLGSQPGSLEWPVYWSPGLGLRWASPIGAIRFEAAHGFLDGSGTVLNSDHSHWQFYLSYGEEF